MRAHRFCPLRRSAASGAAFTPGKSKLPALSGMAQNAIKTAATHGPAQARIDKLEAEVSLLAPPFKSGSFSVLRELVEELPQLREKSRVDSSKKLEKVAASKLVEMSQAVMSTQEICVGSSDVEALMKACAFFANMSGCKEAHVKMTAWAAKYAKILASSDLTAWCQQYVAATQAQPYPEAISVDVKHLTMLISKCPSPMPEAVSKPLEAVLAPLLERTFLQAP